VDRLYGHIIMITVLQDLFARPTGILIVGPAALVCLVLAGLSARFVAHRITKR